LVAVIALVLAMSGGAYAASKFLITSTKQISPKVLKSLRGAKGATGPAGLAGPAGPAGAAGAGSAGAAGAKGETGPPGPQGIQGVAGKEGKEGSPWTAGGVLPSGKTETGVWSVTARTVTVENNYGAPLSFTIPLAEPLAAGAVHFVTTEEQQKGTAPKECSGAAEEPTATPGNLCVYQGATSAEAGTTFHHGVISRPNVITPGAGVSGAIAYVGFEGETTEADSAQGSWAVTAP
jgi:hypothetical protein